MDASALLIVGGMRESEALAMAALDLEGLRTKLQTLKSEQTSLLSELMTYEEQLREDGLLEGEIKRTKGGNSKINRYFAYLDKLTAKRLSIIDCEFLIIKKTPDDRLNELLSLNTSMAFLKNTVNLGVKKEARKIEDFLRELSPWGLLKLLKPLMGAEILRREQAYPDYKPPEKQRRNRKTDIRRDRLKTVMRPVLLELDNSISKTLISLEKSTPTPLDLFEYDIQKNLCTTRFEDEGEPTEHNLGAIKALMSEINSEL